jgi:hypothetical protein
LELEDLSEHAGRDDRQRIDRQLRLVEHTFELEGDADQSAVSSVAENGTDQRLLTFFASSNILTIMNTGSAKIIRRRRCTTVQRDALILRWREFLEG